MKSPDFVGVGFPKCGTSFFYSVLASHPDVLSNRFGKEMHFFSKPLEIYEKKHSDEYYGFFPRVDGKITGEYSPGTLYYPNSISKLNKAAPAAKIIVMIRNPIDRSFSHYKQMMKYRVKNISAQNKNLLINGSIYPESVYSGLYHFSLNQLFKYYDKSQVMIIQYEKFCVNFDKEMNKTCDFLEITRAKFNQTVRLPEIYEDKQHLRKDLKMFYEDDVRNLFKDYGKINQYSEIDIRFWGDFCGDMN